MLKMDQLNIWTGLDFPKGMPSFYDITPYSWFTGSDRQNGTIHSAIPAISNNMSDGDGFDTTETGIATVVSDFGERSEYIFDRRDVRAIFLVLYTIVFCFCFFGNLVVILVVTIHWRMRSITNFFLANLAFADLCVGIFCVYQNIVTYLMDSWVFGEFMCKMYHFINSLSTTASVLILVVICIERYLAIIHPMRCKQMLTMNRLRVTIVFVWILSAAISSPRFYYFSTIRMPLPNDQYEILCLPNRTKYNSKLMDMFSLTVLYLIPLTIIIILYAHIGVVLWKSSKNRMPGSATPTVSMESNSSSGSFYRETDHNIIQTVKLTMLPVPVTSQHQQQQGHYPSLSLSPIPATMVAQQPEKLSSTLFPSPSICLQCRSKSKTRQSNSYRKGERTKVTTNVICRTPSPVGNRAYENCIANVTLNETAQSTAVGAGETEQKLIIKCNTCHYAYANHPDYPPADLIMTTLPAENTNETSFMNTDHYSRQGNACWVTSTTFSTSLGENWHDSGVVSRDKTASLPTVTTCCAKKGSDHAGSIFCLGIDIRHSQGKPVAPQTVTNQTSLPSPFFNRNCPFRLGKKSANTEPIVTVKFETKLKQTSKNKGKKSQCTIFMNRNSYHGRDRCGIIEVGSVPPGTNVYSNESKNSPSSAKAGDEHTKSENVFEKAKTTLQLDGAISQPNEIACRKESGMNESNKCISIGPVGDTSFGNGGLRKLHHENSFQNNFPFDRKRNSIEDYGICGMPAASTTRNNIEGIFSREKDFDGHCLTSSNRKCKVPCSTCETSCTKCRRLSSYCQHNHKNNFIGSQKLSHFAASSSFSPRFHGVPIAGSPAPKRVRRLRVVRGTKYGTGALLSRRRIIRMLIVLVLAFALCHLPYHGRKVWQYWSPNWAPYQAGSVFSTLFTPITFLIMYANSAINPILYAFMSNKFRMSFKDMLWCKIRHSLRISRNASVRSTHAVASSSQTGTAL